LRGIALTERRVDVPWVKDYDAIKGEGPTRWAHTFDITNWGLLAAHDETEHDRVRVGGAVVAWNTSNVNMLEGRRDLAALWDIRVLPGRRTSGVGTLLFRAVEAWALARGCNTLKIETQNINVGACHFYARMGCTLGVIDRFAYPDLPDETRLLWFKSLAVE
jgi:GNAT superfamily N-acetyltransferase